MARSGWDAVEMTGRSNLPQDRTPAPISERSWRFAHSIASGCGFLMLLTLRVVADASQPAASAGAPAQAPTAQVLRSSANTPQTEVLPEVTVQARRNQIGRQVRAFVSGTLHLENDESAARWNSPVCPGVSGLTHDEAEFMLARLSQIARTAGVPLAGERCAPANLYVIATTNPEVFLKWAGVHWRIFEGTPLSVADAFIATPRPVRVWYSTKQVGTGIAQPGGELPLGAGVQAPVFEDSSASHLTRNATWSLTLTVVVVDRTQLQGVAIGQLTDYIGVSAFSRLKPRVHLSEAPTILGLFEHATPEGVSQAPPGMTPWDEAFLEALYHTNPGLVLQQEIMITRMVNHIVPAAATSAPAPTH